MSTALKDLDETRLALASALEKEDWEAISSLDKVCRFHLEAAMRDDSDDRDALRFSLKQLLSLYGQMIYVSRMQRSELAKDATKMKRSQKAANVYKLFG
nr:flagellar protein FliT [Pseudomonas luteola]